MKSCLIFFTVIIGLLFRLYKVNNPIADWHSHRQADTSAVTINLINRFDPFLPKYFDISSIQSGKDNLQGLRLVEFPVYNIFSLITYRILSFIPGFTPELAGRTTSIVFSLLSGLLIYFISFDLSKLFLPSFLSLITFLFLPFNIYYSRSILPEPTAVFFMLLSFFLFSRNILLSSLPLALAVLTKPYVVIVLFPVFLFSSIRNKYFNNRILSLALFLLISLLPFILWRVWISKFPEGVPASQWLFNGNHIRFRPAWFRWLFFERIGKLILGIYGVIPLFLGFAYRKYPCQKMFLALFLGIVAFFTIIATGNVQHDYYQTLIVPSLSIIIGFGLFYQLKHLFNNRYLSISITIVTMISFLSYSWYQVNEYYKINNPDIVKAGNYANQHLPQDSLVIAPYFGDTAFLYQTKRFGYPIEIYDFPKLLPLHPNRHIFFISVNYNDYTEEQITKYPTIYRDPTFIILKIQ